MGHTIFKIVFFFCCLGQVAACKNQQRLSKEEEVKIRMGIDPYSYKVSDSMKHWIKKFAQILAEDQKYRFTGLPMSAEESKAQTKIDSINLIKVTEYLEMFGWPETDRAGFVVQNTVGMVIQHAPLAIQEKYYPMLVKAFQRDALLGETLALLEDRINVQNKKLQYYGTQVMIIGGRGILYPVVNVDSIDAYRSKLGPYIPFSTYMSMLNVKWDPVKYKSDLPSLKKKLNFSDSPGIRFIPMK